MGKGIYIYRLTGKKWPSKWTQNSIQDCHQHPHVLNNQEPYCSASLYHDANRIIKDLIGSQCLIMENEDEIPVVNENELFFMPKIHRTPGNFSYTFVSCNCVYLTIFPKEHFSNSTSQSSSLCFPGCKVILLAILDNICNLALPPQKEKSIWPNWWPEMIRLKNNSLYYQDLGMPVSEKIFWAVRSKAPIFSLTDTSSAWWNN